MLPSMYRPPAQGPGWKSPHGPGPAARASSLDLEEGEHIARCSTLSLLWYAAMSRRSYR